jgi:hypothetical protein
MTTQQKHESEAIPAPAIVEGKSLGAYVSGLEVKYRFCQMVVQGGMVPDTIKKQGDKAPQAVLSIMLIGGEYGFSPMRSLELFNYIQGRVVPTAAALAAICVNSGGSFDVISETPQGVRIRARRPDRQWEATYEFTMAQAEKMGLVLKDNWLKMPGFMMYARCVSVLARRGWPDIIGGLHAAEELEPGADTLPRNRELPKFKPEVQAAIEHDSAGEGADSDPMSEEPAALPASLTDGEEERKQQAIAAITERASRVRGGAR